MKLQIKLYIILYTNSFDSKNSSIYLLDNNIIVSMPLIISGNDNPNVAKYKINLFLL
jgi:hypothetical protein